MILLLILNNNPHRRNSTYTVIGIILLIIVLTYSFAFWHSHVLVVIIGYFIYMASFCSFLRIRCLQLDHQRLLISLFFGLDIYYFRFTWSFPAVLFFTQLVQLLSLPWLLFPVLFFLRIFSLILSTGSNRQLKPRNLDRQFIHPFLMKRLFFFSIFFCLVVICCWQKNNVKKSSCVCVCVCCGVKRWL